MSLDTFLREHGIPKTVCCVLIYDMLSIAVAWVLTYAVCYTSLHFNLEVIKFGFAEFPVIFGIQLLTYRIFRVYSSIWRFSSLRSLLKITQAVVAADVALIAGFYYFNTGIHTPLSIFVVYPLLLAAFWSAGRLAVRYYHDRKGRIKATKNLLIIGGGKAAELFIRDLNRLPHNDYCPRAILDDKKSMHKREIHNVHVYGAISCLEEAIKKFGINTIVVALPSVSGKKLRKILKAAESTGLPVRMLPSLGEITSGKVAITDMREVSLEDLLRRDPIKLDCSPLQNEIMHKTVMITGGGGSIGSELCEQIMAFNPKCLVIVDHSEYNLYQIEYNLKQIGVTCDIAVHLVDITDKEAMSAIYAQHRPSVVYHAAAYKHVPMLENQIRQAMKNNLYGTKIIAELAAKYQVEKFVMVSTDKAVNPTNIMGATKRAAEVFCQNYNLQCLTKFVTVRFGNVLGSAGSVIPLFKRQLKEGGPLTVTDKEITRYFMTIPEACQLILHSGAQGMGGEIFVLDMGEPVKIIELAEQLIKLSGKKPYEDIDIEFTGLRPGEKLYEELFHENEKLENTNIEKVLRSNSRGIDWTQLQELIAKLPEQISNNSVAELRRMLVGLVPEYVAMEVSVYNKVVTVSN